MSDPQPKTGLRNQDFKTLLSQIPFFNLTRATNFVTYPVTGVDELTGAYEAVDGQTVFQGSGVELLNKKRGTSLKVEPMAVNLTLPKHNISVEEEWNKPIRASFPLPFTPISNWAIDNAIKGEPSLTEQNVVDAASATAPFYHIFNICHAPEGGKGANVEVLAFVPYICGVEKKWANGKEYDKFFDPASRKNPKHERLVRHSMIMSSLLDRAGLEVNTFSENDLWLEENIDLSKLDETAFLLSKRGGFTETSMTLIRSMRKMYEGIFKVTPDTPVGICAVCVVRSKITVIPIELLLNHSSSFKTKMMRMVTQIKKALLSKYAAQSEDIFDIEVNGCSTPFKMAYDGVIEPLLRELPSKAAQVKEKKKRETQQLAEFYGEEYGFF